MILWEFCTDTKWPSSDRGFSCRLESAGFKLYAVSPLLFRRVERRIGTRRQGSKVGPLIPVKAGHSEAGSRVNYFALKGELLFFESSADSFDNTANILVLHVGEP